MSIPHLDTKTGATRRYVDAAMCIVASILGCILSITYVQSTSAMAYAALMSVLLGVVGIGRIREEIDNFHSRCLDLCAIFVMATFALSVFAPGEQGYEVCAEIIPMFFIPMVWRDLVRGRRHAGHADNKEGAPGQAEDL